MAETDNIARMAAKVSSDVFGVFGWQQSGPVNANWACGNLAHKHRPSTHPTDLVLWYDDPYSVERIYFVCDLKSYATESISVNVLGGALRALCMTTECANSGTAWRSLYAPDDLNWHAHGLLFVYNHDGGGEAKFSDSFNRVASDDYRLPRGHRIYVLGPEAISYLVTVANDILRLRGAGQIPTVSSCSFWYPDSVLAKRNRSTAPAASIEMLCGPWIIMRTHRDDSSIPEVVLWYRELGASVDEFKYLLEFLFRYQLLNAQEPSSVHIRLVNPAPLAATNFDLAKEVIGRRKDGFADERLSKVVCESVTRVSTRFSEIELGMARA